MATSATSQLFRNWDGEDEMHQHQEQGAQDHERGPLSLAIVVAPEDDRQGDGGEGQNGRNGAGEALLDLEFLDHEVRSVLEKGEDGGVEQGAEHGDVPEAPDPQDLPDVGDVKGLLIGNGVIHFRSVQLLVHGAIENESHQSHAQQDQPSHHGCGHSPEVHGDRRAHAQGQGRPDPRGAHLEPHGQGDLIAQEPSRDELRGHHIGDFDPHAEKGEPHGGQQDLGLKIPEEDVDG